MTFDISSLASDGDTFEIQIINPKTELPLLGDGGRPVSVTVYNPGTRAFQQAKAKQENRLLNRIKRKGKMEETAEEKAEGLADFLTTVTVSFNNFVYGGMEPGPAMFRACYLDPRIGWLPQQVNNDLGDWANFTKSAPEPSAPTSSTMPGSSPGQ